MAVTLEGIVLESSTDSVRDVPPPGLEPDDVGPVSEDMCEVCGKPLAYSGKGRHPTRCQEHKRGAAKSGPRTQTASIERISLHTAMLVQTVGSLVGMVESFDGFVIQTNAEPVGKAVGNIAERDPAFRRKLEAMLARTSYAELVALGMAMMTPIAIHHGAIRMSPESRAEYEEQYRAANV